MSLLNSRPLWPEYGLGIARIITGALMGWHGLEVFNPGIMRGYLDWPVFQQLPSSTVSVYIGKSLELTAGFLLLLGLWTRLASLIMMVVMAFVCFLVGKGEFWYGDQHPFLFVVLGWIFLTAGGGAWSIDKKGVNNRKY